MTFAMVLAGYSITLAPNLTLQDAGELAVASYYAGVPHPPGYPVWTLYSWLFTVLLPFSNIAWRVAVSSAFAGALSCGLLALLVSRTSHFLIEALPGSGELRPREREMIPFVAGFVSGALLGFNGFMWSQAVIVEVYTLSVLSLMGVLCLLFRWMYEPDRRRYLLWTFFLFGICFTNHQTLITSAMGLQVAVALARPALGRDLFFGNSVLYGLGLIARANGGLESLAQNPPLFVIFNAVGVGSVMACGWLGFKTRGLLTEWKTVVLLAIMWLLGASFYLYPPIASMTNPPLNWGYPRTWEGFVHMLTRGQYAQADPTQSVSQFLSQVAMYIEGAVEEFSAIGLLIGVVPLVLWKRWRARERAWLAGLVAIFLCLAFLLLILLNPMPGRQSRELNKVFFTASHVVISLAIGCGLSALAAMLAAQYQTHRRKALYGCAAAAGIAIYGFTQLTTQYPIASIAALSGVVIAVAGIVLFALARTRCPLWPLLAIFAALPVQSVLSHWSDNEQRGHLFGYWYGHDMFSPPFGIYPEMARDAVLFGGTDPGRFNPTYMIFCESFLASGGKPLDPKFDRRDVALITQNALVDGTYLNYVRAHYNRSAQVDLPFLQEMLRTQRDEQTGRTNRLARLVAPLDRALTSMGAIVEERRRKRGVYPTGEIHIPSEMDRRSLVDGWAAETQQRIQRGELGPDADINKMVRQQSTVMLLNGLVARQIFERNPGREFFVEESMAIDWMYPHLTPFGIILKLNHEPVMEITEEMIGRDHEFWSQYSSRLCGNELTYDTTVQALCDFIRRTYLFREFRSFRGDPRFVRDTNAQKAFSGLRNAIAGLYYWRYFTTPDATIKERMRKEADFAYRQAIAFCPFNSMAVLRYAELLVAGGRISDALQLVRTCLEFDFEDPVFQSLIPQLEQMQASPRAPSAPIPPGKVPTKQ